MVHVANKFDLDLDAAWRRVLSAAIRDEVPDVLRFADYALAWNETRGAIERELDNDSYLPRPPVVVEMPKDGFASRPISLFSPRDRVVYEAIIDQLAPHIDRALPKEVYSARVRDHKSGGIRIAPQVRQWVKFQEAGRDLYAEYDFAYLLSTDVTSYFEYVDLRTLLQDLRAVGGVNDQSVELLSRFLNHIEGSSNVWGIPQGVQGSAVLGNLYLLPVDRVLIQHGLNFLRFQDDLKVFADSPEALRVALRDMTAVLRSRRLNLSVHKTKLLAGPDILDEFEDQRKTAIQYGITTGSGDSLPQLISLFDDAVSQSPPNSRDVRFSVHRLAQLNSSHAVPWILSHLSEVPYLAPLLVGYLTQFLDENSEIEPRVVEYLRDPRQNLYPFAELHLVRMLSFAKQIEDETLRAVWDILQDQNRPRYVREHAARCAGRHARAGDVARLKALFLTSDDTRMKRALLVAIREAAQDRAFFAETAGRNPELAATCRYLRSSTALPPP